jgi:hypothetical protein
MTRFEALAVNSLAFAERFVRAECGKRRVA